MTGSKYLLRHGDATILVDCGLFQGFKQLRLQQLGASRRSRPRPSTRSCSPTPTSTSSGYLPLLARQGFRGRVYCTSATHELCKILLTDSGHLQEEEAKFANRHGFSKHQPAPPLYTREDAERCLKLFAPRPFSQDFEALPGLTARLTPSGHMLGSAFVHLNDGRRSVLFLRRHRPAQRPGAAPAGAGPRRRLPAVESTYGNRKHEASDALAQLETVINKTAARGGVVVIPAFAVGRAQSLMYGIYQLRSKGRIHQHLPVYLDSPMAIDATRLYHAHRDEHRLSPEECEGMCHAAKIVNKVEESKALSAGRGPMVINLRQWHGHGRTRGAPPQVIRARPSRHTILFAGYQAGGTRGAAIVHGASTVRIHGQDVPIRAEVASLDNLSAHADADEILAWMRGFTQTPRRTFVTHGEPEAADEAARADRP
ncbi:MBL fold metallo-hydrolase RNA specificity domain-containing protein [Pseudomonas aeruginosa]